MKIDKKAMKFVKEAIKFDEDWLKSMTIG
jgi:hypothetical protein